MYAPYGLFIDGEWIQRTGSDPIAVVNPATEDVLGTVPAAGPAEIDAALAAAQRGLAAWRAVPAWERSGVLREIARLLRERVESVARMMTLESGKPLAEARGETRATADQFDWYADEARRVGGQLIPSRDGSVQSVLWEPVGVVAAFSPWNFPALLPARKIAAALAAGCAVIIKPAEETPGTCMLLAEACRDAGLPPGVLNLLVGTPARISERLIASPIVRKVSVTGSVAVGRHLARLAADDLKRVSLELGGHAPVIALADADPAAAAAQCAAAKFRNAGQVCISPTRFYAHAAIIDRFADAFVAAARQIRVGDGMHADVDMGPLANRRRLDAAEALVADATRRGARLLTGGRRPAHLARGYFFEPTVLRDVPDDARIMTEEPFAPIAPIAPFSAVDEVVARANALPYGLAGYVFTQSMTLARQLVDALEVGMIGVNELLLASAEIPFGGVKHSGFGREGGTLGIFDYLQPKFVKLNPGG